MPETLHDFKAAFFKALASPVRIRLLEELRAGPATVGDLQQRLGLDSSNVSQHLALMRAQGLVITRREGNRIWYAAPEKRVYAILDAARAIFEQQVRQSTKLLRR